MRLATSGPTALWYLTRGTGSAALILLTLSVVLGVVNVKRWRGERWPRFVLDALHRNVSLLVLVLLVIHVLTTVLDGFAPVGLVDAIVPLHSAYRSLWIGLGALSLDLLLAVALTSLLRQRLGYRAWRVTHWLAYASWPLALVHGLASGTDVGTGWMLGLAALCLVAVLWAVCARLLAGWPGHAEWRLAAFGALGAGSLLLVVWMSGGPLGGNWAGRAGTPTRLLAFSGAQAGQRVGRAHRRASRLSSLNAPFTASVRGRVTIGATSTAGVDQVDLELGLGGGRRASIRIYGPPVAGGVSMSASRVTLGDTTRPTLYRGTVVSLQGSDVVASLAGPGGRTVDLRTALAISPRAGTVGGRARVVLVGAPGP